MMMSKLLLTTDTIKKGFLQYYTTLYICVLLLRRITVTTTSPSGHLPWLQPRFQNTHLSSKGYYQKGSRYTNLPPYAFVQQLSRLHHRTNIISLRQVDCRVKQIFRNRSELPSPSHLFLQQHMMSAVPHDNIDILNEIGRAHV